MASTYVYISPLLPIRFAPEGVPASDKFHTRHHDQALLVHRTQPWQARPRYDRLMQFGDVVCIQAKSDGPGATLYVVDAAGQATAVGGGYADEFGETSPSGNSLITFQWTFLLLAYAGGAGRFRLRLVFDAYASGPAPSYISEPILLRQAQQGSLLVRYFDPENKFGIWFDTETILPKPRMELRVNGYLTTPLQESNTTSYQDQTYQTDQLSSYPHRTYQLVAGGTGGISDSDYDILNRAMACEVRFIDGKAFTPADGAKWEVDTVSNYPVVKSTLALVESNQAAAGQWVAAPAISIYQLPVTYPYMIDELTMSADSGSVTVASLRLIQSAADEAAWAQGLTGALSVSAGLTGDFVVADGQLWYIQGYGEAFETSTSLVYTRAITMVHDGGSPTQFSYTYIGGRHVTQYHDTSTGGNPAIVRQIAFGSGANTVNRTFNASYFNHSDKIWHPGSGMTHLYITSASNSTLSQVTGTVPASLTLIDIQNGVWAAVSLAFLAAAKASLQRITIAKMQATSIDTNLLATGGWPGSIVRYDFRLNKLPVAQVDALWNAINGSGATGSGGNAYTQGQTPAAPPTTASQAARFNLGLNSWTVTTD